SNRRVCKIYILPRTADGTSGRGDTSGNRQRSKMACRSRIPPRNDGRDGTSGQDDTNGKRNNRKDPSKQRAAARNDNSGAPSSGRGKSAVPNIWLYRNAVGPSMRHGKIFADRR